MKFSVEAACLSNRGRIRSNNEDNFYFDGKYMEANNNGLTEPMRMEQPVQTGLFLAVFDGMGGEDYGEIASYTAAAEMKKAEAQPKSLFTSEQKYLFELCRQLNGAVADAEVKLGTDRMGTTMTALYFSGRYIYACNVGDSRAYRIRASKIEQLSVDHVEKRPNSGNRKQPLTQHIGIPPEWFGIEPYIIGGKLMAGDRYLLCSDGLTDMLADAEICDIIENNRDMGECAGALVDAALKNGGRDNVTVIVCSIS